MLKFAGSLRNLESCVTLSRFPPPTKMVELTLTDMIRLNWLKYRKIVIERRRDKVGCNSETICASFFLCADRASP